MSDKVRDAQQYHYLKQKYLGLGNPDTTRSQFMSSVQKESLNAIVQHKHLLNYTSIGNEEIPQLYRVKLLKKMAKPN